jgi:hypothetical protein
LNTTDEFNAYVYDDKDLITGDMLFGRWYQALKELKNSFPKNPIVKMLPIIQLLGSSHLFQYLL